MRRGWPKVASPAQETTLQVFLIVCVCSLLSRVIPVIIYSLSLQLVLVLCGDRKTYPSTSLLCSLCFVILCDRSTISRFFRIY